MGISHKRVAGVLAVTATAAAVAVITPAATAQAGVRNLCDPVTPVVLGSYFEIKAQPMTWASPWVNGRATVNSFTAPCGTVARVEIQRKVCGRFGCNPVDRAYGPWVAVPQRGTIDVTARTICKPGTYSYRVNAVLRYPRVSDEGPTGWKEDLGTWFKVNCPRP